MDALTLARPADCAACPRDGDLALRDNPCAFAAFCDAAASLPDPCGVGCPRVTHNATRNYCYSYDACAHAAHDSPGNAGDVGDGDE